MPINMKAPERVLRIVLGILVLGLFGALPTPWRYLTLIGLIPLGTGITGYCPAYHFLSSHDNAARPRGSP